MSERLIDQQRIQAQIGLLNRITRGGEIDPDLAVRERREIADRVDNLRGAYLAHLKKLGWPREMISYELAEFDRVVAAFRAEPFSQQALQMPDLGF